MAEEDARDAAQRSPIFAVCQPTISSSYVGEPECNGVIERFVRTRKKQCLNLHRFTSLADARTLIGEFIVQLQHPMADRAARASDARGRARGRAGGVTMMRAHGTRSHSDKMVSCLLIAFGLGVVLTNGAKATVSGMA